MKKAIRYAYFFLSALLVAWVLIPEGRPVAAGLILGTTASIVNAFLLRRRIELIGKTAAEHGERKMTLGLAGRLATVLLAVMTAYRFPEHFALPAALASCFLVQISVYFTALTNNNK
ncbi:ATP synthase subunit I [Paenibacillus darwinianus]|uniref:ATP synthase subunit I n=1 Tax=Paenibacillus darwinianus TaxID=1380763 RepID=UPI001CC0F694|nr:ATP synthase subunit I [Paenibacillus darwinianus]